MTGWASSGSVPSMRYFGAVYGPAAPPRDDLTRALQQRMLVLGYTPSVGGVYGASEDAVVQSYADQLGIEADARFDLNAVLAQVLPVLDADIEAGAQWKGTSKGPINLATMNVTGQPPARSSTGSLWLLALAAAGIYFYTR